MASALKYYMNIKTKKYIPCSRTREGRVQNADLVCARPTERPSMPPLTLRTCNGKAHLGGAQAQPKIKSVDDVGLAAILCRESHSPGGTQQRVGDWWNRRPWWELVPIDRMPLLILDEVASTPPSIDGSLRHDLPSLV